MKIPDINSIQVSPDFWEKIKEMNLKLDKEYEELRKDLIPTREQLEEEFTI